MQKAKFGMFVHWGLYSLPAGKWNGEEVPFVGEWIMRWKKIPAREYRKLASRFVAEQFNPKEWPALAKAAGMEYFVITAKHHDGFALFDSEANDYNVVKKTPFGRDPMPELAAQCREQGLRFGFYYSHDQDWNEPDASGNDWDFPIEGRTFSRYLHKKALPQVRELLTRFGDIDLIWFDTPIFITRVDAETLMNLVHTLQPDCLTNGRLGHGLGDYEQMGDNEVPSNVYPRLWETPATLNDTWGFKENDTNWKSAGNLIYRLTDIVSKGGCYLLNIGPRADGSVPQESVHALLEVGNWLKTHGEAIYGTEHSPFTIGDDGWRCTRKGNTLYIHLLKWPGPTFRLQGLQKAGTIISKVWMIGCQQAGYRFKQVNDTVTVYGLPDKQPGQYHAVLVVETAGFRISPEKSWDAPRNTISLHARDCNPHGPGLRYRESDDCVSGLNHPTSRIRWQIIINGPGRFAVELAYQCTGNEPDRFEFSTKCASLTGPICAGSGQLRLGEIHFDATGRYQASFRLLDNTLACLEVKEIRLTRMYQGL